MYFKILFFNVLISAQPVSIEIDMETLTLPTTPPVMMAHPKYEFEYKVKDPHTGDIKDQHESRDGDHVTGYYSLHQPGRSVRSIHYHGHHHAGIHADVNYDTPHIVPKYHYL